MPFYEDVSDYESLDFNELSFYKIYDNKPTLYLDQNIIDKIVKYPMLVEDGRFAGYDCQVIYSNETLNEIERSGQPDEFLGVLENLKARKIEFEVNQRFELTGRVAIKEFISPFNVYEEFLASDPIDDIANKIILSNREFIYNLFSSNASKSIASFTEETIENFDRLYNEVYENLIDMKHELPADYYQLLEDEVRQNYKIQKKELIRSQKIMLENMPKQGIDLECTAGQDGIRSLQEKTGVDGAILNNIKSPDILVKIYQKYTKSDDIGFIDDFYLISNKIHGRDMYKFEKVMNIYLMLNIIGYKRDKGFYKKFGRFVSAQSDGQHLAYACYCNYFFSEDKALIDKSKAIFEFLKIKTKASHVTFDINNCSAN